VSALAALAARLLLTIWARPLAASDEGRSTWLQTVPGVILALRGKTSKRWHAPAQSCASSGERRP
jgi:hypothetical protein